MTRRRIDRQRAAAVRPARPRAGTIRRASAGGALLTAVALGLQEVFDPQDAEQIVEEVDLDADADLPAVTLLLVPDAPALSRAWVRPWLLGR